MNTATLSPPVDAAPEAPKKILLVDDAELFLELERSILSPEEVEILVATDGREALGLVHRKTPDLIFLDLLMPGMDGDECCRILKAHPTWKRIPVVMVTGYRREEHLERCRRAGCDGIIFKPIDRQKMAEITRKFLRLRRAGERVPARLRIRYGQGAESLSDFSVNLSTGGVFIETDQVLPENTCLRVEFTLPEEVGSIRCLAKVAWTNPTGSRKSEHLPPGMGLQFLDLGVRDLDLIREYVQGNNIRPA